MQPLLKRIHQLTSQIDAAFIRLKITEKQNKIKKLEVELSNSEIWNNPNNAKDKSKQLSMLINIVDPWIILKAQVNDISDLIEMDDSSLQKEFDGQIVALEKEYDIRRKDLLFDGKYDDYSAIILSLIHISEPTRPY